VARETLVHLIHVQLSGQRIWQCGLDRQQNPTTKQWFVVPLFDDDPRQSKPLPLERAIICKRRWLDDLKLHVHLSLHPFGPFIDDEPEAKRPMWEHRDFFVLTDELNATGFYVRAVHTPAGPAFCLKFTNPLLEAQSIITPLSDGPEGPIRKARERHFLDIEPPQPSPFRAQREFAAREAAEQQDIQVQGRVRPGDRRGKRRIRQWQRI
jgi:hypothetical protein